MAKGSTSSYEKESPETIQEMFGKIAASYDRGNAILSFQMHRLWNRRLIDNVIKASEPEVLLDLCAGTGAIAFKYLQQEERPVETYLLDFCKEMLEVGRGREKDLGLERHPIHYLHADAQEIPLLDASADCVTIAYGIRNVKDPRRCIEEVYRVLRPGGRFGILELTRPKNSLLRFGHKIYLKQVLPRVGRWLLDDGEAYSYLCSSIQDFISPDAVAETMREIGFSDVTCTPMTAGIATLISGQK